ncbi:MAG: hypothetical protein ABII20_01435 [Candidatus Omnitrophota bacterium]|nr:hypothetical protein [Candidatus Omnitrophota bacterium]MBU4123092.1 hypothetical protein [bacterium]
MKSKEELIANLRKQMQDIKKMPVSLKKMQSELKFLIEQLEDESKTGTPPSYNLGSKEYREALDDVIRELKINIKILRETGSSIMSLQKKSSISLPRETHESDN